MSYNIESEFPVGSIVKPHKKTAGECNLQESSVWKRAQSEGQDFLYVKGYDLEEGDENGALVLTEGSNLLSGGDYFNTCDVTIIESKQVSNNYSIY